MPEKNSSSPEILVYSTPWCGFCKLVKEYFNDRKIKFTEYDIEADPDKGKEAVKLSGQVGVPVVVINGKVVVGFDVEKIEELLKNGQKSSESETERLVEGTDEDLPEIKIYSTSWCGACKMAKAFFNEHKIKFTEIDAEDPEKGREMVEKSGQLGVPVIYIGDELIVGFDQRKIIDILAKHGKRDIP